MNVLLSAYSKNNLGDDLFIKIITERYKDQFTLVNGTKNKSFKNIKNLKIRNNYIDLLLKKVFFKYSLLEYYERKRNDLTVLIGGSMFVESNSIKITKKRLKFYNNINKPYYIIGSNFGPFKTKEYFEEYSKAFSAAEDVCFREEYSYNLFKEKSSNIRQATDIVFSLKDTQKIDVNEKKVIFSIVDCNLKVEKNYTKDYENLIIKLINYFYKNDYKIVLMSFCKKEGDERAINKIIRKIKKQNLSIKLEKYLYRGDIKEALSVIKTSEIIVGTRFHANILGLLFNKTIIPISYSDKTINILKDLKFQGKYFDIKNINSIKLEDFNDIDLNYKLNINNEILNSIKHFKKLDEVLEKNDGN